MFFTILFTAYVFMHSYLYFRLSAEWSLALKGRIIFVVVLLLGAGIFIVGEMASHQTAVSAPRWAYLVGSTWLGALAITFTAFFLADLIRIVAGPRSLQWGVFTKALVIGLALSAFSLWNVARGPVVRTIEIPRPARLSPDPPLTIVQLTDLHLNPMKTEAWLQRIVDLVNAEDPDIIVLTGDIIDSSLAKMRTFHVQLGRLKARIGIYASSGNHERYTGKPHYYAMCNELGFKVVDDTFATIGEGADRIVIAGIDYEEEMKVIRGESDMIKRLARESGEGYKILLAHQPDGFDAAVEAGFDLQLSGHTHRGQIPPMDMIVLLYYKYPYGLYSSNGSWLYTSAGTDMWGPRMRLCSRSEIAKIVVK